MAFFFNPFGFNGFDLLDQDKRKAKKVEIQNLSLSLSLATFTGFEIGSRTVKRFDVHSLFYRVIINTFFKLGIFL